MEITIDKIMSFCPCNEWTRERMIHVSGGREEFDTSELASFDVPTNDLIWLTEQILIDLGNRDEYMLVAAFAERVLPMYERQYNGDMRPRNAIRASRLYALGEIDESELYSASAAAWAAASASAWASSDARYARYAACYAASASAWASSDDRYSAWNAARSASASAMDAELKAQREVCIVFLKNI